MFSFLSPLLSQESTWQQGWIEFGVRAHESPVADGEGFGRAWLSLSAGLPQQNLQRQFEIVLVALPLLLLAVLLNVSNPDRQSQSVVLHRPLQQGAAGALLGKNASLTLTRWGEYGSAPHIMQCNIRL